MPSTTSDLSVDEVQGHLLKAISAIDEIETVSLFEALDRVLAQDVISPLSVPPHDNSAMDGFAFDGSCLATDGEVRLTVAGTALAGTAWTEPVEPTECVKIMTGAIMPVGLDTVIPVELTNAEQGTIRFEAKKMKPGANRRRLGEDLKAGDIALSAGQRLTPAALGLLASLGLQELKVFRRLKVAYLSTGDEILSLGEPPREGAVYDSNRYTLTGLLKRMGVEVIDMGVIPDQPAELEAAFAAASAQADAVITSGGVSMGDADHTRAVLGRLGKVDFWRIAMRPGRPMAFGYLQSNASANEKKTLLFGLPGNPVAAMVAFVVMVRPCLQRLKGETPKAPVLFQAMSTEALRKRPGRTEYQRGIVHRDKKGQLCVCTTGQQGSGLLSSMVLANALIVLHHEQDQVLPGDQVDVMLFEGAM